MKKISFLSIFFFLLAGVVQGQDTLPRFSLRNVGANRIVVGWTNNFDSIRQISIQRSFDSLKNFRTILTVPDPTTPQNGYVDTKAPNDHMFYRLYIQLDKGAYLFSESKRPKLDTISAIITEATPGFEDPSNPNFARPGNNRFAPNMRMDSVTGPTVNGSGKPKTDYFIPSKRVYTFPDGYVKISLPEDQDKKYNIKFLTMEDKLLFELKDIRERDFKIDKANFYRSGWYRFEIYENGELLEKHRFFLPREF